MPKYIDADEMLSDESEAYMSAQANIADIETYVLNHLVHAKIQRLLIDAPAADVAPVVHGRWIDNGIPESTLCGCSACGFTCGAYTFSYCPNCGARMDASEKA